MANGDDGYGYLIQTVWSAILTAFGGLVWWNWKRVADAIDKKVDRTELVTFREELHDWRQDQQRQHRENRARLDSIMRLLTKRLQ